MGAGRRGWELRDEGWKLGDEGWKLGDEGGSKKLFRETIYAIYDGRWKKVGWGGRW